MTGAEASVDLHEDIYPLEAVERAVSALASVAACSVERAGPYHRVRLRALGDRDAALLRLHVANWALAAAVEPGRR